MVSATRRPPQLRSLGQSRRPARHPATRSTTTTSTCVAIADHGRLPNHHDSGQCRDFPSRPSVQPARLQPVPLLPIMATRQTTTTWTSAAAVYHGRLPNDHDFGLRPDCPQRPSAKPPRLRPVLRLPIAAVRATTTTSAYAIAHSGRLFKDHGFDRNRDFRLRPSVDPPHLRPAARARGRLQVRRQQTDSHANRRTTTASAGWAPSAQSWSLSLWI